MIRHPGTYLTAVVLLAASIVGPFLILESSPASADLPYLSDEDMGGPNSEMPPTRTSLFPAPHIDDLKYAAIGPNIFKEDIAPLLDWKTQKGVKAAFFSLEDINASYGSSEKDRQEVIRDFLVALKGRNQELDWVLLAGDGELIPPRNVFVNGSAENGRDDPDNYVPTDFYYAGLDRERDGDWDINDNGIYGEDFLDNDKKFEEKDFTADIYIGRFPASTREELRTMVKKQLSYEKDPPPGSWSSSMFLAGSLMDVPNDPVQYDAYKDNAYELVLKVEDELPSSVTPFHLVDYPQLEYGGYNVMFDSLNRSSFESYYAAGFSTVLVACHGDSFNGNCTNYKGEGGGRWSYERDYEDTFTYDMAETIENGERLPLLYISSCASTDFAEVDDTNMERIMRNRNGGAIALIGATVDTYRGEFRPDPQDPNSTYSFGNWWLAQEYFRLLYRGTPRPGEALYKQKWNYQLHLEYDLGRTIDIDQYTKIFNIDTLAYNLLGDPEGPIWLNEPGSMTLSIPDEFDYEEGFTATVVDSLNGKPISGAVITITDPEYPDVFLSKRTGPNGTVFLDPEMPRLGEMRIVAAKEGYTPEVRSIEATSSWDVEISTSILMVPDPPVFGEPVKVVFTIRNLGDEVIDYVIISWAWYDTSKEQPVNRTIEKLYPGNLTVEENFTWDPGDDLRLSAWLTMLPRRLERDTENNLASRSFKVNQPLEMDLMDQIELDEDLTFVQKYRGERLDLVKLGRIVDQDGPEPLRIWGEVKRGNITLEQDPLDQSFDIIPEIDWFGEAAVRFYATDGSVTKSDLVLIDVASVPDSPRFIADTKIVEVLEDVPHIFELTVEDVDSTNLSLNSSTPWIDIQKKEGGHTSVFTLTVEATDHNIGSNPVTFVASDGTSPDVELTLFINVSQTNDPPRVSHDQNIIARRGQDLEIDLIVEDPDGDHEFTVTVNWLGQIIISNNTKFILPIPDTAELGEQTAVVTVDDRKGENGITEFLITVDIREKETEDYRGILLILIAVIFITLIIYGVFLRIQERRQKRLLDSVGTSAPLEARPLSEKDFKRGSGRGRRRRVRRDDGIPMPPAPLEVEGALVREEKDQKDSRDGPDSEGDPDLESDLDDILNEMFP
ncbi:MAG: C25 family cysteine peptidase [Thermoplasmatota archaeon]